MFKKLAVVFLLAVGGLILLLYGFFPLYVPTLAAYALAKQDIQLLALDVGYPGWRRLAVRRLVVEAENLGALTLTEGLVVVDKRRGYVLQFANGQQKWRSDEPQVVADEDPVIDEVSQWLPSRLLPRLPRFHIGVDAFVSEVISLSQFQLVHDGRQLRNRFLVERLGGNPRVKSRVEMTLNRENAFTLNILDRRRQAPQATVTGRISRDGDGTKFSIQLQSDLDALGDVSVMAGTPLKRAEFVASFDVRVVDPSAAAADRQKLRLDGSVELSLQNAQGTVQTRFAFGVDAQENAARLRLFTAGEDRLAAENYIKLAKPDAGGAESETVGAVFFRHPLAIALEPLTTLHSRAKHLMIAEALIAEVYLRSQRLAEVRLRELALSVVERRMAFALEADLQSSTLANLHPALATMPRGEHIALRAELLVDGERSLIAIRQGPVIRLESEAMLERGFSAVNIEVPPQTLAIDHEGLHFEDLRVNFATRYPQHNTAVAGKILASLDDGRLTLHAITDATTFNSVRLPAFKSRLSLDLSVFAAPRAELALFNACDTLLASGVWQGAGGEVKLSVASDQTFAANASLRQWLNIAGLPFDIVDGRLEAGLAIDSARSAGNIRLALADVAVISEYFSVAGVQFAFSSAPLAWSAGLPSELAFAGQIDRADVGVTFEDIKLSGRLTKKAGGWRLHLASVEAGALGGRVSIHRQGGRLGERMRINVQLKNLDLAQVIATQQLEGLVVTGRLSGELPIIIERGKISLGIGEVESAAGGWIRYSAPLDERVELNEQLKLTLAVLENFNYEALDSQISYSDGNLVVQSKISGRNPDVVAGRRVDLNLNTQVELDSALQVMRLQSGLEAQIEEFVAQKAGPAVEQDICQL